MPFHLEFKDCLFDLQISICSNVLYTALSPTGEHERKQIPFSTQPGIFKSLKLACVLSEVYGQGQMEDKEEFALLVPLAYFSILEAN